MKRLKIACPKIAGRVFVDERNYISDAPDYWRHLEGSHLNILIKQLEEFGKVQIAYMLNKEIRYEHRTNPKRPQVAEGRNRFGENKFGQVGREGNRTSEPTKEKPRVIIRRRNQ